MPLSPSSVTRVLLMRSRLVISSQRVAICAALLSVVAIIAWRQYVEPRQVVDPERAASNPIGSLLNDVQLSSMSGKTVSLRSRLQGRATLIFVVGRSDCAGCSNLPLELRILQRQSASLNAIVVASGSSTEEFRPYLRAIGLDSVALVDPTKRLLSSLSLTAEPATVLVDSSGRVLLLDARSTSRAAQFPVTRVLHDIAEILSADHKAN